MPVAAMTTACASCPRMRIPPLTDMLLWCMSTGSLQACPRSGRPNAWAPVLSALTSSVRHGALRLSQGQTSVCPGRGRALRVDRDGQLEASLSGLAGHLRQLVAGVHARERGQRVRVGRRDRGRTARDVDLRPIAWKVYPSACQCAHS